MWLEKLEILDPKMYYKQALFMKYIDIILISRA